MGEILQHFQKRMKEGEQYGLVNWAPEVYPQDKLHAGTRFVLVTGRNTLKLQGFSYVFSIIVFQANWRDLTSLE